MQPRSLSLFAAVALAAGLHAQVYVAHPIDNLDSSISQNIPFAGGISNWDEARSQFLIPAAHLPPTGGLITAIELVPISTNTFSYERFELYLDLTQVPTLSSTFASNTVSPQLVFNRSPGTVAWTGPGWFQLPLDTPFVYDGQSNLLIECRKKIDRPTMGGTISPNVSHRILAYPRRADLPTPIWAWGTYGSGVVDAPSAATSYSTQVLMRVVFAGGHTLTVDSTRDTTGNSSRAYFHLGATLTTTAHGQPGEISWHMIGVGLAPSQIPVPTVLGGMWLMPPLVIAYGMAPLDASGLGSSSLVIPNDVGLIGFRAYLQGLVVGSSTSFTNVVDAPMAAY